MEEGKKRLATLVGCNYPGTPNELHGCINDVLTMRSVLVKRFGFNPNDITTLTDSEDSKVKPTGENIREALNEMVSKAEAGDVLFFHYSGHGTLIPASMLGHKHGYYEAIVPTDYNLMTDLDFRWLVNQLPTGTSFTFLSDSCHSGGLIDKEKEQIGPHHLPPSRSAPVRDSQQRFMPIQAILNHLAAASGLNSQEITYHLHQLFGDKAFFRFESKESFSALKPASPDVGILLSGCQSNETSADAFPDGDISKAFGAFSMTVKRVLASHAGPISNRELVIQTRGLLNEEAYAQHPCLYCSDQNADAPFLCQPLT
ncbi:metacaspase-9 [Amborella trichopoda]|uniref:Peptidase C14 caspase domain-containing protein n=1 Tax=Amborella trichopoda TaxID=13333 RepID=W1NRK7_AMBTC|nr:metacaspase-9 [Amborella trichopoda]ERM98168.1 hypothetical protein AMTR_s00095p00111310 [Amborella trichopoda]|eukprot:XP_006832890.1 metacaspase-9 [Amborella trichopoda]